MNINKLGNISNAVKKTLSVLLLLSAVSLSGCRNGGADSSQDSEFSSSSADGSTHIPIESSSDISTETSHPSSSAQSSKTCTTSSISSSADSSSETSSAQSVASTSVSQSNGSENSSSSSVISSEPEVPPAPVVIPNFEVPSSPGTNTASSAKGVIDYSNASRGYISVKYTGDRSRAKLIVTCDGKQPDYTHDVSVNGTTDYFPLSYGSGNYTVTLYEKNVDNSKYTVVVSAQVSANMQSSLSPFLVSNAYCDFDQNSQCVYKAAELCAGKTEEIDKIAAIFNWVTSNVTYDYALAGSVQSGYMPDPEKTYNIRTGICYDYASLMCAMLRSQSIPTRLVKGYASPDIYHAWNEVYTEQTGWITPELMLKNAGYNIVDSTFYANTDDKAQISSYISNSANYQAIYYY